MKKKQNPIEILEYQLVESRKNMAELSTTRSKFRAQQTVAVEERTELAKRELQLQLVVDSFIRKGQDDLAHEAFNSMSQVVQKKDMADKQITYLTQVVTKLDEQYGPLKSTIHQRENDVEALKVKYEFTKSMGNINKQLKGSMKEFNLDFTSIEDLEKQISIEMHTELDQNDMITNESTLNKMATATLNIGFEAYKEERQKQLEAK
jgi:phage shock protein A